MLDNGATIDIGDDCDLTPLHLAVLAEREDIVISLLERGADVDAKDHYGLKPLDNKRMNNQPIMQRLWIAASQPG